MGIFVKEIFENIVDLLGHPNPSDALDSIAGRLYTEDPAAYNHQIEENIKNYGSKSFDQLKKQF